MHHKPHLLRRVVAERHAEVFVKVCDQVLALPARNLRGVRDLTAAANSAKNFLSGLVRERIVVAGIRSTVSD